MANSRLHLNRRSVLKAGAGAGFVAATPVFFTRNATAATFRNDPGDATDDLA